MREAFIIHGSSWHRLKTLWNNVQKSKRRNNLKYLSLINFFLLTCYKITAGDLQKKKKTEICRVVTIFKCMCQVVGWGVKNTIHNSTFGVRTFDSSVSKVVETGRNGQRIPRGNFFVIRGLISSRIIGFSFYVHTPVIKRETETQLWCIYTYIFIYTGVERTSRTLLQMYT